MLPLRRYGEGVYVALVRRLLSTLEYLGECTCGSTCIPSRYECSDQVSEDHPVVTSMTASSHVTGTCVYMTMLLTYVRVRYFGPVTVTTGSIGGAKWY